MSARQFYLSASPSIRQPYPSAYTPHPHLQQQRRAEHARPAVLHETQHSRLEEHFRLSDLVAVGLQAKLLQQKQAGLGGKGKGVCGWEVSKDSPAEAGRPEGSSGKAKDMGCRKEHKRRAKKRCVEQRGEERGRSSAAAGTCRLPGPAHSPSTSSALCCTTCPDPRTPVPVDCRIHPPTHSPSLPLFDAPPAWGQCTHRPGQLPCPVDCRLRLFVLQEDGVSVGKGREGVPARVLKGFEGV